MLAEFLLFHPFILAGLKKYIDFSLLNVPMDFITHTLLIQYGVNENDIVTPNDRLKTVSMVLDSGFKLNAETPEETLGLAAHNLLIMDVDDQKFKIARRLLSVGYRLFSNNHANNNEIALILIDNRTNADAKVLLKDNRDRLKTLIFKVGDNLNSNLADYYYWVKEDMQAVDFIKKTLNLEISP